jgi:hypothetical protein
MTYCRKFCTSGRLVTYVWWLTAVLCIFENEKKKIKSWNTGSNFHVIHPMHRLSRARTSLVLIGRTISAWIWLAACDRMLDDDWLNDFLVSFLIFLGRCTKVSCEKKKQQEADHGIEVPLQTAYRYIFKISFQETFLALHIKIRTSGPALYEYI